MALAAHALVAPPTELLFWIGVLDTAHPQLPTVRVPDAPAAASQVSPLQRIRDGTQDRLGRPLNHHCLARLSGLPTTTSVSVEISTGGESMRVRTRTLPATLPAQSDGGLNILLSSCYSQPEDGGLLGRIVSSIKRRPDLALLLGDQIYGDLPIFEDLPADDDGVARTLARKYRLNFTNSEPALGGLGAIFARAPVACVADDHEYWNNFPYRQNQLPKTWTQAGRDQWALAARNLYEDYQQPGPGGAQRIRFDPLEILLVDMRSSRDDRFDRLVSDDGLQAMRRWRDDLLQARQAGRSAFGMLVSGQALMVAPTEASRRAREDAEMANYAQLSRDILPLLEDLASAGIPMLYVTGDVHWGRIAHATDVRSGQVALYEVIVSPSRLIRFPGRDRALEFANDLRGIFGTTKPWPRHGSPSSLPLRLREQGALRPDIGLEDAATTPRRGDQVAILSLARAGRGVDFQVTYYGVSDDKALSQSVSSPVYSLRNL